MVTFCLCMVTGLSRSVDSGSMPNTVAEAVPTCKFNELHGFEVSNFCTVNDRIHGITE
jgi:hypothetical protein